MDRRDFLKALGLVGIAATLDLDEMPVPPVPTKYPPHIGPHRKLYFDGRSDTYITETSENCFDLCVGR